MVGGQRVRRLAAQLDGAVQVGAAAEAFGAYAQGRAEVGQTGGAVGAAVVPGTGGPLGAQGAFESSYGLVECGEVVGALVDGLEGAAEVEEDLGGVRASLVGEVGEGAAVPEDRLVEVGGVAAVGVAQEERAGEVGLVDELLGGVGVVVDGGPEDGDGLVEVGRVAGEVVAAAQGEAEFGEAFADGGRVEAGQ